MGNTAYKTFEDNKHSVDDKIWLLERYLLATSKQAFFDSLVYNSEIFKYMRYSDYLNNPGDYDTDKLEKEMKEYLTQIDNCLKDEINFKQIAQKAALETDKEKRKKLLEELNDKYFSINFNFKPPPTPTLLSQPTEGGSRPETTTKSDLTSEEFAEFDMDRVADIISNFDPQGNYGITKPVDEFRNLVSTYTLAALSRVDLSKLISKGSKYVEIIISKHLSNKSRFHLLPGILDSVKHLASHYASLPSDAIKEVSLSDCYDLLNEDQVMMLVDAREISSSIDFVSRFAGIPVNVSSSIDISRLVDSRSKQSMTIVNYLIDAVSKPSLSTVKQWLDSGLACRRLGHLSGTFSRRLSKDADTVAIDDMIDRLKNCVKIKDGWPAYDSIIENAMREDFIQRFDGKTTQAAIVDNWLPYFEKSFVSRQFALTMMQRGHKVDDLTDIFSEFEMAEHRYKKTLKIKNTADLQFEECSQARIVFEIKGLDKLQIAVYEVDAEKYFTDNPAASMVSNVDTSGFKPHKAIEKRYDHSKLLVIEEVLDLSKYLTGKGVYIVEAVGGGLFAKATIAIGSLAVIESREENQIVIAAVSRGDKQVVKDYKLLIDGDTYSSDQTSGQITIKASDLIKHQGRQLSCIIKTSDGIVQRHTIDIPDRPSFDFSVLYNDQSISSLSPIRLTLLPSIWIDPSQIEATMTYASRHDDITTRKIKVKRSTAFKHAYILDDVVIDDVKAVSVDLSTPIGNCQHRLAFGESSDIVDLSLTVLDDRYLLTAVGKNGELLVGKDIRLVVGFESTTYYREFNLTTDHSGSVSMHRCKDIKKIEANIDGISKRWNFGEESSARKTVVMAGQSLLLPPGKRDVSWCSLVKLKTGSSDPHSIVQEKVSAILEGGVKCWRVSGLEPGEYELLYLDCDDKVEITVLEGNPCYQEYVPHKEELIPLTPQSPIIGEPSVVHNDDGSISVSLSIISHTSISPMMSLQLTNEHVDVKRLIPLKLDKPEVSFQPAQSAVESGTIGFDTSYVIDRQESASLVGCTLDKPSYILDRRLIGKTNEADRCDDQCDAAKGQRYDSDGKMMKHRRVCTSRRGDGCAEIKEGLKGRAWHKFKGDMVQVEMEKKGEFGYTGCVRLTGENTLYNQIVVSVIGQDFQLTSQVINPAGFKPVAKKDISLQKSHSPTTVAFEQRDVKVDSSFKLSEGSKSKLISTVGDLLQAITHLTSNSDALTQWSFLANWPSLSVNDQLSLYSTFTSNELNLFLYFKDKEFAEMVIKPHLRNKNRKNVVDYFILGDTNALKEYFNPYCLSISHSKLNFLEICLLIISFKDSEPQECKKFVQKLKQQVLLTREHLNTQGKSGSFCYSVEHLEPRLYRSAFDRILNGQAKSAKVDSSLPKKAMRQASSLDTEYVDQMANNVSSFNAMGVTQEVIEREWLAFSREAVKPSLFWLDFLEHTVDGDSKQPFLSDNWIEISKNPAESLAIISVIDLPFESEPKYEEDTIKLATKGYLLERKFVSKQQEQPVDLTKQSSLMISQKFFTADKRTEVEVLHPRTVYTMEVIVMNCNDSQLQGTLITQIPQGSVPLGGTSYTEYVALETKAFDTARLSYTFYYSDLAEFKCYPSSMVSDGKIIAQASLSPNIAVELPKQSNYKEVLEQFGKQSADEASSIDLKQVYHKLKDEEFYRSIISILKKRFEFDAVVWSFSLYHGDLENLRDYIKFKYQGKAIKIKEFDIFYFCNKIFSTDFFNFREYCPLTNPRVHNISQYKHNVINRDFLNTYYIFLKYVQDKGKFESTDLISMCVYLLMQDRILDAADIFKRISRESVTVGSPMKIQYDYLDCFLSLALGELDHAKEVSKQYIVYPVISWRDLFRNVLKQVYECEQVQSGVVTENESPETKKTQCEPLLESSSFGGKIRVLSRGIASVTVHFYEIDLEMMFTKSAESLLRGLNKETYLKPNFSKEYPLTKDGQPIEQLRETLLEAPPEFKAKNFIARLESGSLKTSVKVSQHSLKILPVEAYGQLKVCSMEGKPIPRCYVKCLSSSHNDSNYKFYKDGYTDLRGNFDYVSLNSDSLAGVKDFLILVISAEHGGLTIKTAPPKRVSPKDRFLVEVSKKHRISS